MDFQIGNINKLSVKRETDISYTLTNGEREAFLHFNQTPNPLQIGDEVSAFLYFDQKKRLCATLEKPIITTTKYDFVKVVDVNFNAGVFVNIGIVKDILLSKDYLTINTNMWPKIGDEIPCILKLKSDQLVARLINKADEVKAPHSFEVGDKVTGIVSHISPDGLGIYTKDYDYIFVHKSLLRDYYHLGSVIDVKIININKNNEYDGSTIENKELARLSDSDYLYKYLKGRGGVIPFGNMSEPTEIMRTFHLSKSAFKRAIGNLYKQHLITIEDYRITLIDYDPVKEQNYPDEE